MSFSLKMQSNPQISMNSKIKSITYMNGFRTQDAVAEQKFYLFLGRKKKGGDENLRWEGGAYEKSSGRGRR